MVIATTGIARRRPQSKTFGIDELVELAGRGQLRVPVFQRQFVWDRADVRRLFDSVWQGFPIGTLLLWSADALADELRFGPVTVLAGARSDALWVVDGQQRVTTLVGALGASAGSDAERSNGLFDVCFDLRNERFVHTGKRPLPPAWLPLRVTLRSGTLLGWLREHGEQLEPDELDLADQLAGALRDYKVPAYIVEHDDEDVLREVFDRVNSAGKPISRAQVFHALFGGKTELASAAAVIAGLRHEGFGDLDDQRVVQSLLAIRGGDVARDLHDEFEANEDAAQWYDDTERALSRTIGFLRRHNVPHIRLVPSKFPIPVLAAFFHLHPEVDPWTERLLGRWLWRGWVHGYGRSGQTPVLRQAVRAVHPKKGDPSAAPPAYDAVAALLETVGDGPPPPIEEAGFRTDSIAGRLALLALAHLKPKQTDGSLIDLVHELDKHGVDAVTELVAGHRSNLAGRGFWLNGAPLPTGQEERVVLDSHAINESAAAALRTGDVVRFIVERGNTLRDLVTKFLESRVEPDALNRPPLDQLFVPDDDLDEAG